MLQFMGSQRAGQQQYNLICFLLVPRDIKVLVTLFAPSLWTYYSNNEKETMLCYAKSLQSCPTLCNPIDGSPPGSPVPGILQARTLEWAAISISNA